ncbi:MotA/TolQ/ExbB proton channel family protein [Lutibacter sp. TH_r2]|uniref:MotA/TolQ/ExbB proton channel family protein n=1 Tax=Lutibacter sp. TH_r2 TaxID=3082083 RepID=UPI002953A8E9|nr:MotA/TolQ/ExbB proton channel family protein [Lutibacter sp. TH_r2]MDV7187648.1 MotA/TolQ/ExbB proton channel family protein [Lutibacter sp. TH_r2]
MLLAFQTIKPLVGNPFIARLNEGGPLFMYTTLFLLIVILALLIRGFIKTKARQKTITLVSSISLFVLVWGFLGQMIGLITAFDAIEAAGDISPAMLAGGLKIAILSPLFGMVVFLIARIGIIILNVLKK